MKWKSCLNCIIFIYFAQDLVCFFNLKTHVFLQFWKMLSHSSFEYCLSLILFSFSSGIPVRGMKAMDLAPFLMAKSYTQFFFFFWKRSQARFSQDTQIPDLAKLTSHGPAHLTCLSLLWTVTSENKEYVSIHFQLFNINHGA